MKLLTIILLFIVQDVTAQIKNADFEIGGDSIPTAPKNWNRKITNEYTVMLDSSTHFSGARSLKVASTEAIGKNTFLPFSQLCEIELKKLQQISVTAYIKTDNVKGNTSLWCQLWDKNDKTIGFGNLAMQNVTIAGNNDWKKYSLNLTAGTDVKKLLLGGFLAGKGTAWFDNFNIETRVVTDTIVSDEVKKYIDEFTQIVKVHSLYTDSINWNALNADIHELSRGLKTISESRIVTDYIISKLRAVGDNHSFFQSKQNAQNYSNQNVDGRQAEGSYLEGNIGYIKVPGFGSINDTAGLNFATKIQELIKSIDTENRIRGWIVDLRENTGGNMYPMIAGLGPLIGNGIAGYFITSSSVGPWMYNKGVAGVVKIKKPYTLKNSKVKIAVLVGPRTSSSGEMTTISFIGKKNTKLFGQPTGGYTTGNSGYPLSDGANLYLAVSYTADRNKKKYLHKIDPDVTVEIKEGIDNTIETAKKWLMEK